MNSQPNPQPFDSSRAWSEASAMVAANRDLVLALAGVFLVLPAFAMAVLVPSPEPQAGASPEALLATFGDYYRSNALALIGLGLVHTIGVLSLLALFTDSRRPTVGESIRQGFARAPSLIAAQIIMSFGLASAALLIIMPLAAFKSAQASLLGLLLGASLVIWALVRLSLLTPAVVVENLANPVAALRRSWQLTGGSGLRLGAFYALLVLAFAVIMLVAEGASRMILTVLAGPDIAGLVATLVATLFSAAMTVYFTAVAAATHRQLAGPGDQSMVDKFA